MPDQKFRVTSAGGMWLRTAPVVSEDTKKVLLPRGQVVNKLGTTDKPDWWRISTTFQGANFEGFSNKNLMVPDGPSNISPLPVTTSDLITRTLAALAHVAPQARDNYLQAIRAGGPLFEQHGITTSLRMAQ